ncbi:MAG: CHAT domain-containing protein, partial [bacterium]|nr:CHAT domain-containing protein [bacterium]
MNRRLKPSWWWIGAGTLAGGLLLWAGVSLRPAVVELGELHAGASLSGELAGNEARIHPVTVDTGQTLRVQLVDGRIAVTISDPQGRRLLAAARRTTGPEPLIVVAETPGSYVLEVRPAADADGVRYEIAVARPYPATDHDRRYAEALQASYAGSVAEESERAIEHYEKALDLWTVLGVPRRRAVTLKMLGGRSKEAEDRKQQVKYDQRAIAIFRELGEQEEVVRLLNANGQSFSAMGQPLKALAAYRKALATAQLMKAPVWEAHVCNNLGYVHKSLGHIHEALTFYEQAREIYHHLGLESYESNTLHNLGKTYQILGRPQEALDRLETALELLSSTTDLKKQAAILTAIGVTHHMLQAYEAAVDELEAARKLHRQIDDPLGKASTLDALGTTCREMGNMEQALMSYEAALVIWRRENYPLGTAKTTSHVGWLNLDWDRPARAREYLEEALPQLSRLGDRDGEAHALMGLARILRRRGDLARARRRLEEALDLLESLRRTLYSQELRSSFVALRHDYYELYIDLLMAMHDADPAAGYDALALAASERARARSLLELLIESGADIRRGVPAELIAHEERLHQQMKATDKKRRRLLAEQAPPAAIVAVEKEQRDLTAQFEHLQAELRVRSPWYAALIEPQPLTAEEIQQLLDDETLLLVYVLGQERSFLWLVDPATVTCYQLAGRSAIEKKARQTSYWLQNSHLRFGSFQGSQAAAELSDMVLGPVAGRLEGKRLLVVSDGRLAYVPFGALPAPPPVGPPSQRQPSPLIVDHEIVHLPSASVLSVLRQRAAARRPAPRTVAVVADPVFTADDPRIAQPPPGSAAATGLAEELVRAAEKWGVDRFERLPFSRREANAILELVPAEQSLSALDFDANRETVVSGRLAEYRIIHFATHAMLHEDQPELSGLMLSLVDRRGRPVDGRLYMHEIYGLELPAELVVLSACRSALGEQVRGEGLVGLTRGCMYAGATSVVVSLWEVNDRATAELMGYLYQGMLA